jgi:hypothetical protein
MVSTVCMDNNIMTTYKFFVKETKYIVKPLSYASSFSLSAFLMQKAIVHNTYHSSNQGACPSKPPEHFLSRKKHAQCVQELFPLRSLLLRASTPQQNDTNCLQ